MSSHAKVMMVLVAALAACAQQQHDRPAVAASTGASSANLERAGAVGAGAAGQRQSDIGLTVRVLPPAQRKALGIEFGLQVEAIDPGADVTGKVTRGDVIVALNDEKFSSVEQFERLIAQHEPGSSVALLVRRGEQSIYIPVKVLRR